MDLKAGPQQPRAFAAGQTVSCDYVEKKMSGRSPKFTCAVGPDDEVKVKYGRDNGEVYGEVAATRLLWALGFGADHMYPVRVVCRGCPKTLGGTPIPSSDDVSFDFATIERKMQGKELEPDGRAGWAWPELDIVDEALGGASRAQRDALKLLAVLLQHTDSKPEQQRLLCQDKSAGQKSKTDCSSPLMMINDLGLTFGRANLFNRNALGSVNFERWAGTPVWKDGDRCVGQLSKSLTGTLKDPVVSEAGRQFLADLLIQLSDSQLHDLFEVARFEHRTLASERPVTVDEWVAAFRRKRSEIVDRHCPQ
jgi:hypothetical protein